MTRGVRSSVSPRRPVVRSAGRHPRPDRIQITRVGLWYVLVLVLVLTTATNTGNNALYVVLGGMGGLLGVSWILAWWNLSGLTVAVTPPAELYAGRPQALAVEVRARPGRGNHWLLLLGLAKDRHGLLVPRLAPGRSVRGYVDLTLARRGRHRVEAVRVASLFPFGLLRAGRRHPIDLDLLVYPELFPPGAVRPEQQGQRGEERARRSGAGYELRSLRPLRPGDDPRFIHWKQSARTGSMVYTERHDEEGRRLSIVFDNGVGSLDTEAERQRFEHLVSEAATAAVDYLDQGFEVELVTRDGRLSFAAGRLQRRAILECLALLEAKSSTVDGPLATEGSSVPRLRLGMRGAV